MQGCRLREACTCRPLSTQSPRRRSRELYIFFQFHFRSLPFLEFGRDHDHVKCFFSDSLGYLPFLI